VKRADIARQRSDREQRDREQSAVNGRIRAVQGGLAEFGLNPTRLASEFVFDLEQAEHLVEVLRDQRRKIEGAS
jgi:hypothetical protein